MPPEFFIFAFLIDIALGEPAGAPHPVQAVGFAVTRMERLLRGVGRGAFAGRLAGAVMVAAVAGASFLATYLVVHLSYRLLGVWGGGAVTVYLAYTTISARGLAEAALSVKRPLEEGDIHAARGALSMIVGRDTAALEAKEAARGAVETVAENSSDGVVAPLFYMALGGVPLAMAYKAVNTMDSMVGYRSEKYRDFGWAAARLDDVANFVPARLAAIFMVVSSSALRLIYPGRFSAKRAWAVFLRDRKKHTSPNSGSPEAAAAGSLGVRLGGQSSYFGKPSVKPYIGEPLRELCTDVITDSVRLMYATSAVSVAASAAFSCILHG